MSLPLFKNYNVDDHFKYGKLLNYSSLPLYLKWNPYIKSGYRTSYSIKQCIKSIFQFTNESVNIWSHLIGFFIFLYFLLIDNFLFLPLLEGGFMDHLIISIGLLCYIVCMSSSVCYHLFSCHSEAVHRFCLSIDLMGICIGLIGCYLPGIYFAFYCFPTWNNFYMFFVFCLATLVLTFQVNPRCNSGESFCQSIFIFLILAIFGVVPICHWVYLNNGFQTEIVSIFLEKVIRLYLLGGVSFLFYFCKIPERFFPGRFDFIGSSHQIWHLLVIVCFYDWHFSGVELFKYRSNHKCNP